MRPCLDYHISDFQILQMSDLGPVLARVGHPPECPVRIEQPLPLTLHKRKQHGDLRRPNTLTGMLACSKNSSQRKSGQPFGKRKVRAGEFGDKRAPQRNVRRSMSRAPTEALYNSPSVQRCYEVSP